MSSPVKHVETRFPKQGTEINKLCQQWHDHTKTHIFPWPKEGTFDANIIAHTAHTYRKKRETRRKIRFMGFRGGPTR